MIHMYLYFILIVAKLEIIPELNWAKIKTPEDAGDKIG